MQAFDSSKNVTLRYLKRFEQPGRVDELKAVAASGNHWLRLFDSMDLTQDGEALVETPWCNHVLLCWVSFAKCKVKT